MTRKKFLLGLFLALAIGCVLSYAAVALINQVFLTQWVAGVLPEGALVRRVHVRWPSTIVVDYASWAAPATPQAPWLQVPHATVDLFVTPLFLKRVVIRSIVLDQPRITIQRDADGHWNLPPLGPPAHHAQPETTTKRRTAMHAWSIAVLSVHVKDGTIVLDDRRIKEGFHGELADCDLAVHQPLMPWRGWRTEVELRGTAVLRADRPKGSLQLSGWINPKTKDLEGTLTVKDFDIGAVENYINQGRLTLRFYRAQADVTAALTAVQGDFTADCQATLTNLTEGDIAIKGVTVLNLKDAVGGPDRAVHLRIVLRGPLQTPRAWRPRFIPTGEQTIKLLRPLFEGRKETIILKVLPQVAGERAVENIQGTIKETTKELRKQFKRLLQESVSEPPASEAPPVIPEAPPAVVAPATTPPPPPTEPAPAATPPAAASSSVAPATPTASEAPSVAPKAAQPTEPPSTSSTPAQQP